MERKENWQACLKEFIRAESGKPFKYGKLDGAMFTAGAVEAMTGVDLARGYRGYKTAKGGLRKIAAKGHKSLAGPFEVLKEITPFAARVGDVVVVDGSDGDCLGIMQGGFVFGVNDPEGVCQVSKSKIKRAFKVGK